MSIPRRFILQLPLPGTGALQQRLLSVGVRTTADLEGFSPQALAHAADISEEDAATVLHCGQGQLQARLLQDSKTARELFEERPARRIITFCADIDHILGGGIIPGQLTEICGVPGVGKTQFGIQLAVDIQIPYAFGGLGSTAIYIDTEGSCTAERVEQVAEACIRHLRKLAATPTATGNQADAVACMDKEGVLANIHLYRVTDLEQQLTLAQELDHIISEHPMVKLVVLDSVAFPFRQDSTDMAARARQLAGLAQCLTRLAVQRRVAVVIMNQVTTKVGEDNTSQIIPALGDSWAHAAATRILLSFEEGTRRALVFKSPSLPERSAEYQITADGVRGRPKLSKRPRSEADA